MNYQQMACEYLEEVARLDRRLEQLQRENRRHREPGPVGAHRDLDGDPGRPASDGPCAPASGGKGLTGHDAAGI